MGQWIKRGLVLVPPDGLPWMTGYAAVPCVRRLDGTEVRVFFSGRDAHQRSHIGSFDFDPTSHDLEARINADPALQPGEMGTFDESGTMSSWVVDTPEATWMYYVGWTRGVTVPFYNSIGLARSLDGGLTFDRVSRGPILSRDLVDPIFTASSCVMVDEAVWKMWYVSCVRWELVQGRPRHYYNIRYAESDDGLYWRRSGAVCIDFQSDDEYAISRPSVIRDHDKYRMWYSYRGSSYRIGYAESTDGVVWRRMDDEAGMDVSASGWDADMVEYPCVFDHDGRRFMLYNGNGYGKTGIGLAELNS